MSKIIGIDLGTTNSVVAVMEGGEPSSSRTPRAAGSRRLLWDSPSPANVWSAKSPSGRPSPTPRTPCFPSSVSWAVGSMKCPKK